MDALIQKSKHIKQQTQKRMQKSSPGAVAPNLVGKPQDNLITGVIIGHAVAVTNPLPNKIQSVKAAVRKEIKILPKPGETRDAENFALFLLVEQKW